MWSKRGTVADVIDALRTVAEYAKYADSVGSPNAKAVRDWCMTYADVVAVQREANIRVGVALHRLFGNDGWTDEQFAELGELARREVTREASNG